MPNFGQTRVSRTSWGYTITEVMVVLAVTGLIFLSAVLAIAGRQNKTEFTLAIQNVQTQIQQTINEVNNGFYPNKANFVCTGSAGNLSVASGANNQGTNQGCIFVGKALQFAVSGTNPEQFMTYSIAALQTTSNGQEVQSYQSATPLVLAPGNNAPGNTVPAALGGIPTQLHSGLKAVNMYYCVNAAACDPVTNAGSIGAVAFLSSLGSYGGGQLISGSQHINPIPIITSSLNSTSKVTVDVINGNLRAGTSNGADALTANPPLSVAVCFRSGGTNQSGLVSIGGSNSGQLSVTLQVKNTVNCT